MTYILPVAFAAMVLVALLLPSSADRVWGALGLPAFALGAASVPFLPQFRSPNPTLWISAALLLLAPAMLVLAAWRARARLSPRGPVLLLVLASVGAALVAVWPTLRLGGVLPAVLTTGALALGCLFVWMVASQAGLGRGLRWLDTRLPAPRGASSWGTLGLVTGAIVVNLGWALWPLWIQSWQPIGVGLGVLAAWWAVAIARVPLALAGAGFAACFGGPEVARGAWVLLGAAVVADRIPARLAAAAAAAGGYLIAPSVLGAEVVFTVLLAGAATALLAALASATPTGRAASR